jgi:hypothetical protein
MESHDTEPVAIFFSHDSLCLRSDIPDLCQGSGIGQFFLKLGQQPGHAAIALRVAAELALSSDPVNRCADRWHRNGQDDQQRCPTGPLRAVLTNP